MKTYVINLKSQIERRRFQERQFSKLGLDFEFIDAVSIADIDDRTYQKHYHDWLRPLKRNEVACYYSHRSCWVKVINKYEPALILEDDALLSSNIGVLIDELEQLKNIDLIDLETTNRNKSVSKKTEVLADGSQFFKLYINSYGAAGYLLFPSGAKKLLDHESQHGIALADAHIASCYSMNTFQIEPAKVIQFDMCKFFGISPPDNMDTSFSATAIGLKQKKTFDFRYKRWISELALGIRKLMLIFNSKRRIIQINKKEFS